MALGELQTIRIGAKHDLLSASSAVHKLYCGRVQVRRVVGGYVAIDIGMSEYHGTPFVNPRVSCVGQVDFKGREVYSHFVNVHRMPHPAGQDFR